MAILSCGQDQFVVDQPFGCPVEQSGGWVNVDRCSLNQGLVPLLRVFLSGMSKEPRANRSSNKDVITAGR